MMDLYCLSNAGGFFPIKFGEATPTSAGAGASGRKRIGIAGYQDVVFIFMGIQKPRVQPNILGPITNG